MYRAPAVQPPSTRQLQQLSDAARLNIAPDDLEQYKANISVILKSAYDRVDKMAEPLLPGANQYPTTPGYLPSPANNRLNAWARILDLAGAPSGKLAGKTLAIKDNVHMAGVPLRCGSNFTRGFVSSYNATVVTRILDAGGVIKGKSVCEDLCVSGHSVTSTSGPVLNPYDLTRSTGGSSSGSAALVASGEVDMAIGTDQGGSIRLPSSWCGIVGLKPTYGLVPYTGILPLDTSLDFAGPMARTVRDCALLLEVIAGSDGELDPRQPTTVPVQEYTKLLGEPVSGLRVGLLSEGFEGAEPEVAETIREAANSLKQLGVSISDFSFSTHNDASAAALIVCLEGTYDTYMHGGISPLNGRGFKDTMTHDFLFKAAQSSGQDLPISMKNVILTGSYVKEQCGSRFYGKAVNVLRGIRAAYDELFKSYDVIIMPTIKFPAPEHLPAGSGVREYLSTVTNNTANTFAYNGTGHPALTINAGFTTSEPHLPIGMMLVGRHFDDVTLLRLAQAYETLRNSSSKYTALEAAARQQMTSWQSKM